MILLFPSSQRVPLDANKRLPGSRGSLALVSSLCFLERSFFHVNELHFHKSDSRGGSGVISRGTVFPGSGLLTWVDSTTVCRERKNSAPSLSAPSLPELRVGICRVAGEVETCVWKIRRTDRYF